MAATAASTRRGLFQAASVLALWIVLPFGTLRRAGAGESRAVAVYAPDADEVTSEGDQNEPVSSTLMQIMCAHCAAYAELGRLGKRTDPIAFGHALAPGELERLDALGDMERDLFLRLCRYPASNDAERHEKAVYLLAFCDGDEFEREHVEALLASMGAGDSKLGHPDSQSS